MTPFQKLVQDFMKFPGIGKRQAERFAYFILNKEGADIDRFIDDIKKAHTTSHRCEQCFRLFSSEQETTTCTVCSSEKRNSELLMIVAKEADLEAIEKSGSYDGLYFVLGDLIDFGEQEELLKLPRVAELKKRIISDASIKEIIFALPFNPEGEHTRLLLAGYLASAITERGITSSTLGRGLSTGTELEYSDKDTLQYALKARIQS